MPYNLAMSPDSHRHPCQHYFQALSRIVLIHTLLCRLQNLMNNTHTNGQYGYHSIQNSGHAPSGGGSGGMLSSLNSGGAMHTSQPANSNANAAVMIQQLQMMEVRACTICVVERLRHCVRLRVPTLR